MNISPSPPPAEIEWSLRVWRLLGNELDYEALPVQCEILGLDDIEGVTLDLVTIRNFFLDQDRERAK